MIFTLYDGTGAIVGHFSGADDSGRAQMHASVPGHFHPAAFYIDVETAQARPRETMLLTVDYVRKRISGLPRPCTVAVEGRRYEVRDGVAEFTFAHPGPYIVAIESPRHIRREVELP